MLRDLLIGLQLFTPGQRFTIFGSNVVQFLYRLQVEGVLRNWTYKNGKNHVKAEHLATNIAQEVKNAIYLSMMHHDLVAKSHLDIRELFDALLVTLTRKNGPRAVFIKLVKITLLLPKDVIEYLKHDVLLDGERTSIDQLQRGSDQEPKLVDLV